VRPEPSPHFPSLRSLEPPHPQAQHQDDKEIHQAASSPQGMKTETKGHSDQLDSTEQFRGPARGEGNAPDKSQGRQGR
jgi:hypothetical protein